MTLVLPFTNTYARLPQRFFVRIDPTPVSAPRLVRLNESLADNLGLDAHWLRSAEGVDVLAGKRVPEGAEPLAAAYAGHQFGHFVPQLGDGRATLLGEVIDRDGVRRDIQLKGSGRTPFSRQGDGRAALGPVLREYIVSEAMFALRIPTTRALAAVTTGETVYRETPLPGAVLTRVASSHIRVGTFQFFASRSDVDGLRTLADYVIARHYPEAAKAEGPYRALLEAAITSQADLVARWLLVGFIHGVMNTDNMSIAGETIDYGPCAFMDAYDPGTVYSSIDQQGRYAYGRQPSIAFWNLTRLAEAMLPLLDSDEKESIAIAERALQTFAAKFEGPFHAGLRRKIGLSTEQPNDLDLAAGLLKTMHEGAADFTLTFRGLSESAGEPERLKPVRSLFSNPSDFDAWAAQWLQRLTAESEDVDARRKRMQSVNPAFIPRNHLVEAAIAAAVEKDDYQPTHELMTVLSTPYEEQPVFAAYAAPPQPHERVQETFCGT